jgi:hypothetical protein
VRLTLWSHLKGQRGERTRTVSSLRIAREPTAREAGVCLTVVLYGAKWKLPVRCWSSDTLLARRALNTESRPLRQKSTHTSMNDEAER